MLERKNWAMVGSAVASKSKGPQFESSHQQFFLNILTVDTIKIQEKEAGDGPLKIEERISEPSDWMLKFTWLLPSNQSAFFLNSYVVSPP